MHSAFEVADRIMVDSAEDNSLRTAYSSFDDSGAAVPQAEQMSSRYGSFGPVSDVSPRIAQCRHPFPLHPLDERVDESLDEIKGSNLNPLASPPLVRPLPFFVGILTSASRKYPHYASRPLQLPGSSAVQGRLCCPWYDRP
jgi:hypothetical protein